MKIKVNPFGIPITTMGLAGFYLDYLIVKFIFGLGHAVSDAMNVSRVIGTGIGLIGTWLLLGLIILIGVFSFIGVVFGLCLTFEVDL